MTIANQLGGVAMGVSERTAGHEAVSLGPLTTRVAVTAIAAGIQRIERPDLGVTSGQVARMDFASHHFVDVSGKEVAYEGCDFSSSIIERGYFFRARFRGCNFTGARLIACNFRSATFENCRFDYADFHRCVVPVPQLLANLPSHPNVRRELLHNVRANARSIGDSSHDSALIKKEVEAEIEYWRAVRQRPSGYYEKYNNWRDQRRAWAHTCRLIIERHVWGHGESLWRLALATLLFLAMLSIGHTISNINNFWSRSVTALVTEFYNSLLFIFSLYVDLPSISPDSVKQSPILSTAAVILRYVSIGMALSVLYKHISKR